MNDVLGLRDHEADPVVSFTSYGMPHHDFVRVRETYESIPFSDGKRLIKREVVPRARGACTLITVRVADAASAAR